MCLIICDPMDCSIPGYPVHHQFLELAQTHVHRVGDAIQPSHPLSSPSPPDFYLSQHQSFPMSQFFTSGGQSIGVASALVFPMNIQEWFPLGWTGLISLLSQGLSRVFSSTTVQKHQVFGAQLSLWSKSHIQKWLLEKPKLWLDGPLSVYTVRCSFIGCMYVNSGGGHGTPLQSCCLENPMDRGVWWAAVHEVAKNWTRLSDFTFPFQFHALEKALATHSSVLAWRIPGMGEPSGLPSMGSHRVGHDWSDFAAAYVNRYVFWYEFWYSHFASICLTYLFPFPHFQSWVCLAYESLVGRILKSYFLCNQPPIYFYWNI